MSTHQRTPDPGVLSALVESDFDLALLLRLLAEDPLDPLCRKVYEALYPDRREIVARTISRTTADTPD